MPGASSLAVFRSSRSVAKRRHRAKRVLVTRTCRKSETSVRGYGRRRIIRSALSPVEDRQVSAVEHRRCGAHSEACAAADTADVFPAHPSISIAATATKFSSCSSIISTRSDSERYRCYSFTNFSGEDSHCCFLKLEYLYLVIPTSSNCLSPTPGVGCTSPVNGPSTIEGLGLQCDNDSST